MSRGSELMLTETRDTKGQKLCERMFDITSHQGNSN